MPTIRIAVQLHPQHGAMTDLLAAARAADELGADLIYTWDHFYPLYGDPAGAHFAAERDYLDYGYPFGTAGSRLDDLEQALPRIARRLARLNPQPVRPIPMMIGGNGLKRTLRLAARHADIWHCMFPAGPAEAEPLLAALRSWCEVEQRDYPAIELAVGLEPDQLDHDLAHHAAGYLAMGFTQFTLGVNGPDYDVSPVKDWLAWRDAVSSAAQDQAPPRT